MKAPPPTTHRTRDAIVATSRCSTKVIASTEMRSIETKNGMSRAISHGERRRNDCAEKRTTRGMKYSTIDAVAAQRTMIAAIIDQAALCPRRLRSGRGAPHGVSREVEPG